MSAGAAVSMAALCLRAPNTNVGIKGQRRRQHSSQLALSLARSLSRSLSPLALSLSLSHTHSHTHTQRHRLKERARARHTHTHTHTQSKEEGALRLPGRTQPGICNRSGWKEWGARVRGWDGVLRIYPAIRQI